MKILACVALLVIVSVAAGDREVSSPVLFNWMAKTFDNPPPKEAKVKTDTHDGVIIAQNKKGAALEWSWFLQTKDYKFLLYLDNKDDKAKALADVLSRYEGKAVILTSRAGGFTVGGFMFLFPLDVKEKK